MRRWTDSGRVAWGPPPGTAVPVLIVLVAACAGGVGIATYRYREVWTPLQRQYLWSYVRSAVGFTTSGSYDLLQVVNRKDSRAALDEELVSVTTATGETSFALSGAAIKGGATQLVWQRASYNHCALHRFLGQWIYQGQTLFDLVQPGLWGALALFLGGIIGARSEAVMHARAWRDRYAPGEPEWARTPPVIDVDPTSRVRAPSGAPADRPPDEPRVPGPARVHESSARALAAGEASYPGGPPGTSPSPPPHPFFK